MMAPDATPFAWASIGEAGRFLAALAPTAERFHFRTFSEPNKGNGAKYDGPLSEVFGKLERANANGHGVFAVVNEGGQDAASITRVRAVFADLDDAPLDPVLACALPPSIVVQSSPSRFHAYWLADGIELGDFRALQKAIAARFGGDAVVCDLPRVMRIPGFHNRKGEPFPVAMRDDLSCGQRYSAEAIRREFATNVVTLPMAAGTATAGAGAAPVTGSHATLPGTFDAAANAPGLDVAAVRDALRHLDAGNSATWREVACSLRSYPDGWQLVDEWSRTAPAAYSEGKNKAAWSKLTPLDGGAAVLFARAQAAGWVNTASAPPAPAVPAMTPPKPALTFRRVGELLAAPPPEYLIDGWLVVDTLAGMIGRSGSGKSFCALTMALCIGTGKDFFGCEVKAGPAFYLAGEGVAGLTRRAKAWAKVNNVSLDPVPLFIADRLPPLTENVGAIIAAISAMLAEHGPPRLIVIDTLARAFNGEDENSASAMSHFVAALDRIRAELQGVTVLVVHHTGHEGTRARGSSAYYASLDVEIMIERDKNDRVSMNNTKSKDAAPPPPMLFDLEPVEIDGGPASAALRLPHDPAAAVQEQLINSLILEPAALGEGYKLSEREASATLNKMGIDISRQAIGKRRRKYEDEAR